MSRILPCFHKLRVTALLLLGLAIAVSASAQPGQSPMGDPSDVAAEIQTELGLDEAQLEQLAPVMGGSIRSVINLVMENSDKRMGVRQKLKLARSMKKIKADADAQMKTILTPQQQQQLEAYREQRES